MWYVSLTTQENETEQEDINVCERDCKLVEYNGNSVTHLKKRKIQKFCYTKF